jgi:ankyrin repeat protein
MRPRHLSALFALLMLLPAPAALADANTDLLVAAATGNIDAVDAALRLGADVNAAGEAGLTALDAALDRQRWTAAEHLFECGALLTASVTGKERALLKLLDLEPVLHPRTRTLVKVVDLPGPKLFRAVLAQGASTTFTDERGNTLLMLAAKRHHVTALQALLAAGAEVDARNADGDTALAIASGKNEYELMVIGIGLALQPDRDALMKIVFRPAQRSDESPATARRLEAAKLLLAARADPDASDRRGDTALFEATRAGDAELVALLIAAGASVDRRNAAGNAPLLMAAQFGLSEIAAELIGARADLKVRDDAGHTPLEVARAAGHVGVVALLEQATPD